jgi:hypothetical protein
MNRVHGQHVSERLGDGEAFGIHHVRQPCTKADGDAEERGEADHACNDPRREHAEDNAERIAFGVARGAGRKRVQRRRRNAETPKDIKGLLAAAMRCEIAGRFRQGEPEHPNDQRTDADEEPYPSPGIFR